MKTKKTARSPGLAISGVAVILCGIWIGSLGVMALRTDLFIGILALSAAALLVASGMAAIWMGSWRLLKDILSVYWY